jgi:MFS family permease
MSASLQNNKLSSKSVRVPASPTFVPVVTPVPEHNLMKKNNFWVYILIVVVVLIIIFWYASSRRVRDRIRRLNLRDTEWVRSSSGKVLQGILLFIALMLLAWATSQASGCYRDAGDMMKCNTLMGVFLLWTLFVLAGFVCFFNRQYQGAYFIALIVFLLSLLVTVAFGYSKMMGPAIAMGAFTLWALFVVYTTYKVQKYNRSRNNGSGSGSGSGNGSGSGSGSDNDSGNSTGSVELSHEDSCEDSDTENHHNGSGHGSKHGHKNGSRGPRAARNEAL